MFGSTYKPNTRAHNRSSVKLPSGVSSSSNDALRPGDFALTLEDYERPSEVAERLPGTVTRVTYDHDIHAQGFDDDHPIDLDAHHFSSFATSVDHGQHSLDSLDSLDHSTYSTH